MYFLFIPRNTGSAKCLPQQLSSLSFSFAAGLLLGQRFRTSQRQREPGDRHALRRHRKRFGLQSRHQSKPLKTIGAAASAAETNNQSSIGTKVIINPGTYRESIQAQSRTTKTPACPSLSRPLPTAPSSSAAQPSIPAGAPTARTTAFTPIAGTTTGASARSLPAALTSRTL